MPAPVIRQFVGTIPDKGQSQTTFDTNVDAWLDWTTLQFAPDLVAFGEFASDTRAALVAANLPPLTGRAANMVRVNAAANGVEFRTPAQVLSDIGAASVASVALKAPRASPQLTGTPMAPTAAAATNTTQLATTAYTRKAIPNVMNASGSAPIYAARAWVTFSGTGTPSIRAGGNVSSITDNGPGDYTVNFVTAMQDHYYSAQVTMDHPDSNRYFYQPTRITKTASSYRFKQTYDGGAAGEGRDSESSNVTILR